MGAIQVLDNAIVQISSMQNAQVSDAQNVASKGRDIKNIARRALVSAKAQQSSLNALEQVSFESSYTGRLADKMYGFEGMNIGIVQTYQTGVQMVINILRQERDLRVEKMETERQDKSLNLSRIAIIVSVLSLLVALFK